VRIGESQNLPNELEKLARRKILLADLNPFDTSGQNTSNVIYRGHARGQTAAIGDVAADEVMVHARKHALSV
jgi:hypothetical protein